jgi:hypothetical protein
VIGTGTVGHIGYGYRNGTGNSWTYGATEAGALRVTSHSPSATHSWHAAGTWAQMLSTFGAGTQPHGYASGPGYYIEYRCTMVTSSNAAAAAKQVTAGETSGYQIGSDDCLTKSVAILRAYGVPSLPSATGWDVRHFIPDYYFTSLLPSYPAHNPGFNGVQWFTTLTVSVKIVDPVNGAYLTTKPLHATRPMHVQIFDAASQVVFDSDPGWTKSPTGSHSKTSIQAKAVPGTDEYTATFQLPGASPSLPRPSGCGVPSCNPGVWSNSAGAGAYIVKVRLDYSLVSQVPGIVLISQGLSNGTTAKNPVDPARIIVGDINQDNQVSVADYNLLAACYSDLQPPKGPCPSSQQTAADLNDDGHVNGIDYNILLRILTNQGGG